MRSARSLPMRVSLYLPTVLANGSMLSARQRPIPQVEWGWAPALEDSGCRLRAEPSPASRTETQRDHGEPGRSARGHIHTRRFVSARWPARSSAPRSQEKRIHRRAQTETEVQTASPGRYSDARQAAPGPPGTLDTPLGE